MHIALIETSPRGQKGSMARYADLLDHVLSREEIGFPLRISRVNLALPFHLLARIPWPYRDWFHQIWITITAFYRLSRIRADIFHIVDGSQAYVSKFVLDSPCVATCHDLIPLLKLKGLLGDGPPRRLSQWLTKCNIDELHKMSHIIAVSNHTAQDLECCARVDAQKVSVVYSALPIEVITEANRLCLISWSKRRLSEHPYMLHVSNRVFYKNWMGVLRIYVRLLPSCSIQLKVVGPPPDNNLERLIEKLGIRNGVSFVARPNDDELFDLYRKASLFLFPSLYEGFGWPPLEAMAFGCPVVCSNAASLPEVVGDAALTCAPEDEKQMAENCLTVLQDDSVADCLIELGYEQVKKFSLERMRNQIMAVYEKVLSQ